MKGRGELGRQGGGKGAGGSRYITGRGAERWGGGAEKGDAAPHDLGMRSRTEGFRVKQSNRETNRL